MQSQMQAVSRELERGRLFLFQGALLCASPSCWTPCLMSGCGTIPKVLVIFNELHMLLQVIDGSKTKGGQGGKVAPEKW
jgi:hypothetical protein